MRTALILFVMLWGGPALADEEQALIVHFTYGSRDLSRLFQLEEKLELAIDQVAVGEYDGNEVAVDGSDGHLYMYGPDADKLADTAFPSWRQPSSWAAQ